MSVWVWIAHNKEWLFSGAGLLVVTGIWKLLTRKTVSSPPSMDLPSVATQAVTVAPVQTTTQSPVINVSPSFHISNESASHEGETKSRSSGAPSITPANKVSEDPRPRLYSLPPRITRVSEKREDAGEGEAYGLIEGGDVLQAVVATFRMRKPPEDGREVYVTARLSYRTVEEIAGRDIGTPTRPFRRASATSLRTAESRTLTVEGESTSIDARYSMKSAGVSGRPSARAKRSSRAFP